MWVEAVRSAFDKTQILSLDPDRTIEAPSKVVSPQILRKRKNYMAAVIVGNGLGLGKTSLQGG
jgi:hypothetical protein